MTHCLIRWMCHAFMALKDSGERLSHAVGCAFAICLERKQRRDKECAVEMQFCNQENTFTRLALTYCPSCMMKYFQTQVRILQARKHIGKIGGSARLPASRQCCPCPQGSDSESKRDRTSSCF